VALSSALPVLEPGQEQSAEAAMDAPNELRGLRAFDKRHEPRIVRGRDVFWHMEHGVAKTS
jgi:hypothetical protein